MKSLKRFLVPVAVLQLGLFSASAQDVIVMDNETVDELRVKVVEVSEEEVKYKKWDYQEGPVFVLSTDKIYYIRYQNGEKQRFAKQKTVTAYEQKQEPIYAESTLHIAPMTTETTAQTKRAASEKTETSSSIVEDDKYYPKRKGTTRVSSIIAYWQPIVDGADDRFGIKYEIFNIGYNIADNLYVGAGLGFSTHNVGFGSGFNSILQHEDRIFIPLNMGYVLSTNSLFSLDLYTGPRLNFAVAGKISQGGEEVKYKDIDGVERFSADWTIGVGVMFGSYGLGVEYGVALGDTAMDSFSIGLKMIF